MNKPLYFPSNNKKNDLEDSRWETMSVKLCKRCNKNYHHNRSAIDEKKFYNVCHQCFHEENELLKTVCLI